ncbi:hypothetical protein U1Q18_021112 [Sarracenia purpurea var. burkii]
MLIWSEAVLLLYRPPPSSSAPSPSRPDLPRRNLIARPLHRSSSLASSDSFSSPMGALFPLIFVAG